MGDTVSKRKRSDIMKAIKSKDTKMEVAFRKAIWRKGFRYSKNSSKYFGKPDIVLKKYKMAIFLDSCFWHGCEKHCRAPTARKKYWTEKIKKNKQRDKEVNHYYKKIGWEVMRVWEHEITKNSDKTINKIISFLEY